MAQLLRRLGKAIQSETDPHRMFDATDYTPKNAAPVDRRHGRRQRTFLHAKLVFPVEGVSQDCTIRNLSENGASLETSACTLFMARSLVVITKTGAAHEVELVWREGARFGIHFSATYDLNDAVPPGLRRLHQLWIEQQAR